ASIRAESMLASLRQARPIRAAVSARLRRGEPIDGFGHPLYRDGDPRARLLLDLLGERYGRSAEYRFITAFARAAAETTGDHPNIDFGLAAAARVLNLPAGSPFTLFAIGRTVGWLGHALEQYATGQLIRPRARYVGVPPLEVSGWRVRRRVDGVLGGTRPTYPGGSAFAWILRSAEPAPRTRRVRRRVDCALGGTRPTYPSGPSAPALRAWRHPPHVL